VLFNVGGTIRAIENSCPHNGASLASGKLEGNLIQCPAHGLRFDLTTGRMPGAGGLCLTTIAAREVDGTLVIAPDRCPAAHDVR
jgi:3-phenylpropionate/trans-cinnamate dioxygenase ferredoxin subunit